MNMTSLIHSAGVDCAICERDEQDDLTFFCAGCARSSIYLSRLEHARILMDKHSLHNKIDSLTTTESNAENSDKRIWEAELLQVQLNEARKRAERMKDEVQQAKQDMDSLRIEVEKFRAEVDVRKNVVSNVELTTQQENSTGRIVASLSQFHSKSTTNRAVLCREAASLMRLRQRRRQSGTNGREQYSIAGLTLPDLRDISNVRCADLSAVLSSVAHLTILAAFYLGIRLPAEILLPNSDHPYPMICTPNTSYRGEKMLSSDTNNLHQSSPSASRHEIKVSAKARPLFVVCENREERLHAYQNSHSQGFNLFVEGIALLAWDIAWLSRSQGFTSGTNDWEGICNMGKNLHQLIVANPQAPSQAKLQTDQVKRTTYRRKEIPPRLGQNSDVSAAITNIRTTQNDLIAEWSYLSWQAVATSLRKILLTEIASVDWELLQDDEWDQTADFDEAVMIKPNTMNTQPFEDSRAILTNKFNAAPGALRKPQGTSGWTKLHSRE